MTRRLLLTFSSLLVIAIGGVAPRLMAQGAASPGKTAEGVAPNATDTEWRTYGGDLRSTRYMPLDQINRTNFNSLEVAWRLKTEFLGPRPEFNFQVTPLVVKGVLYTPAGSRRAVIALDAETGEMLWMHRLDEGKRGEAAPRRLSGRGLAYWSDGKQERIVYVTPALRHVTREVGSAHDDHVLGDDRRRV